MRRHWGAGSGQGSPSWRMGRRPHPRPLTGAAHPPPPAGCWDCWRTGGGGAGSVRILSAPHAAPEPSGRSLKKTTGQSQTISFWFDKFAAKRDLTKIICILYLRSRYWYVPAGNRTRLEASTLAKSYSNSLRQYFYKKFHSPSKALLGHWIVSFFLRCYGKIICLLRWNTNITLNALNPRYLRQARPLQFAHSLSSWLSRFLIQFTPFFYL